MISSIYKPPAYLWQASWLLRDPLTKPSAKVLIQNILSQNDSAGGGEGLGCGAGVISNVSFNFVDVLYYP